jgi:hypothetical protein
MVSRHTSLGLETQAVSILVTLGAATVAVTIVEDLDDEWADAGHDMSFQVIR